MTEEEDIDNNPDGNNDDRFTRVENDVFNIEGYRVTKSEEVGETIPEVSAPISNKDKNNKGKKEIKKFKIIFLGEKGVGKTSLIKRYANNTFSNYENQGARNAVFHKKCDVDKDLVVELTINDTSEVENLQKYPKEYYRDAHGAILVFSFADHRSFEKLEYWKEELFDNAPEDIVVCILGNQVDRTADKNVTSEEAKAFAEDNLYFEVSAKAGNNVSMAFEELINRIIKKQQEEAKKPKNEKVLRGKEERQSLGLKKEKEVPEKKKKCC